MFDAVWTHAIVPPVTAVLTMTVSGAMVSIQRRQSSNGNDCDYRGALAADRVTVSGVYFCTVTGGPWYWEATIT